MSTPRFSVVIPTRERSELLRVALQTCLDQEFDDYEIVVCDNCSSPATRAVVEEFASDKIRYFRSNESLAMTANWEKALSHARGEWVTVLGDDDGLMRHALKELDRLTRTLNVRAIRWEAAMYLWPTFAIPGDANYLRLPLSREVCLLDGKTMIDSVIRFASPYSILPMIYNAVVHRDLLATIRTRTGHLFGNNSPDVYSGFAVAYLAGSYASTDVPMSVAGLSGRSNGVSNMILPRRTDIAHEYHRLNKAGGYPLHAWIPDLSVFPETPVADAFLFVKEALFPDDETLCLDRQDFVARCVRGIRVNNAEEWQLAIAEIRRTCQDDPVLLAWYDNTFRDATIASSPPTRLRSEKLGFDGNYLHLDVQTFGVEDVAGAVRLCEQILNYRNAEVIYDLRSAQRYEEERTAAEEAWQACFTGLKTQVNALTEEAQRAQAAFTEYRNSTAHRLADRARDLMLRLFRRAG